MAGISATLTVRLPEEEKKLITDYAQTFGTSASELVRQTVMEKIEDEIDARDLIDAIEDDDGVRFSMDEVLEMVRKAE